MEVYRIAKWQYLDDLSGTGARIYGGRWNYEGHSMLYTSRYLSLAVLELLSQQARSLIDDTYGYIKIQIPHDLPLEYIDRDSLSPAWRTATYHESTLAYGTKWLQGQSAVALIVPSAVLAQESNVLLNPEHMDFSFIKILQRERLALDSRLQEAV